MIKIDREYGIEAVGSKLDLMYELTIGIKSLYDRKILTKKDIDTIMYGVVTPQEEIEKENMKFEEVAEAQLNELRRLRQRMIDLKLDEKLIAKITDDIETAEKAFQDLKEDR